jgi:hypothetical protein
VRVIRTPVETHLEIQRDRAPNPALGHGDAEGRRDLDPFQ